MSNWMLTLITLVVSVLSPELRKNLETMLNNLEESAKKTANPWDDILVSLLKNVLLNK